MHVGEHHVETGGHDAQRPAGENDTLIVEAAHQHLDTAVDLAEHVLFGYETVFENQLAGVRAAHAQLVELLGGGKAGKSLLDEKGGNTARTGLGVGLGVDHQHIGVGSVGDPHLVAVQHIAAGLAVGAQAHADHIGAGARLAHCQSTDMLAADQFRQILAFLLFVAVSKNLVDAEVGVGTVGERHRCRGPAEFLHGEDMVKIAHARTAVLLAHGNTEQPEIAHLAPEVGGELVFAVNIGGPRGDFGGGKIPDRVPQQDGRLVEIESESGKVDGGHSVLLCVSSLPVGRAKGMPAEQTRLLSSLNPRKQCHFNRLAAPASTGEPGRPGDCQRMETALLSPSVALSAPGRR